MFVSFGLSLVIIWSRSAKLCIFTYHKAAKSKGKTLEDNICLVYLLTTSLFCIRSMLVSWENIQDLQLLLLHNSKKDNNSLKMVLSDLKNYYYWNIC